MPRGPCPANRPVSSSVHSKGIAAKIRRTSPEKSFSTAKNSVRGLLAAAAPGARFLTLLKSNGASEIHNGYYKSVALANATKKFPNFWFLPT